MARERKDLSAAELRTIDICGCGHSRADHEDLFVAFDCSGACLKCNDCPRGKFTWDHFDPVPELAAETTSKGIGAQEEF